jgi:hypothetical protein
MNIEGLVHTKGLHNVPNEIEQAIANTKHPFGMKGHGVAEKLSEICKKLGITTLEALSSYKGTQLLTSAGEPTKGPLLPLVLADALLDPLNTGKNRLRGRQLQEQ